jgi:thiol-disulfide isomerase/thioredoxin
MRNVSSSGVIKSSSWDQHRYTSALIRGSILVIILTLLLAACTGAAADQSSDDDETATQLPADVSVTVYQGAGALAAEEVLLSDLLARGKPLVLNFWAGLCPPCRLEMPDMQAVYERFQDEIILFGLDVGPFTALGSRDDGRALVDALGVTYPTGTTFEAEVVRAYQVTGMPSTFFILPDGEIVRKWTGILTEEKLVELVEELLARSQAG